MHVCVYTILTFILKNITKLPFSTILMWISLKPRMLKSFIQTQAAKLQFMDAQWPQGIGVVKTMEDSKAKPQKEQVLNCRRCNSRNTKFCYYNNYSLSQPRYFCKTCRRYWTEGGSMRNVPVGGSSRKNKKSSSSSSPTSSSSSKKLASQNPNKINECQDLNLVHPQPNDHHQNPNPNPPLPTSFGLFPLPEFKPNLNFCLDGFESSGYGNLQEMEESAGARLLFPIDDLKQASTTTSEFQLGQGESSSYWNGMLGGRSW